VIVKAAAAVIAVLCALAAGLVGLVASAMPGTLQCTGLTAGPVVGLDSDQAANARLIVAVGQQSAVPEQGLLIALMTAMQESTLRNLDYGDRDSLGLFQQRPSTGWGLPAQVTDPAYAAAAFYGGPQSPTVNPGLLDVPGWEQLPTDSRRPGRSALRVPGRIRQVGNLGSKLAGGDPRRY
jgi:hypothetical protein